MSVTINITDPATTSPEELQAVITMLRGFLPQGEGAVIRPFAASALPDDTMARLEPAAPASVFGVPVPPPSAEMPVFALVPPAVAQVFAPLIPPVTGALTSAFDGAFNPAKELVDREALPPVTGADLDKDGIPWDGRIHASTKTKTVEAVWKKKRGIEQAEVDRVVTELRTTMMAPAASVPVPPAVAQAFATGAASPVVPPAPPAPPAPTGITFAEFMGHVTRGVTSARFTREAVADACAKHGAANLPGLINRPDLIPAVARELGLVV